MIRCIQKNKVSTLIITAIIFMTGLYGCGDSTVAPQADNLGFNVLSSADSVGDNQNILILDTVKILIKEIKVNVANKEDSTNFKAGPFVLFLNLTSSINPISTGIVPAGSYDKIKFEVHKLNDNEPVPDPDFADVNGRYSVVVKGSYMGNYFVFKSSKSAHQKLNFPNALSVAASTMSYVTMIVRPYIWFIENDTYLDPRDPGNADKIDNNIKDNIKNNFKAFKDNDKNGLPD